MHLDLQAACRAAERAASEAAEVISEYTQSGEWSVSLKADESPVTEVDIASEKRIKSILMEALPAATFYGEETGVTAGLSDQQRSHVETDQQLSSQGDACRWLVDPIDGTKSFVRGMPYYSTQIALEVNGQLLLGVSNAPAYGQRLVSMRGEGACLNDQRVECRTVTTIKDAFLSSGNLSTLAGDEQSWLRYGKLVSMVRRVRGYGDFCHYHQLCCGQADIVVESDVNILDIAALSVAVHEAGGVMTDLKGSAIDEHTTSVLATCTQALHEEVLAMLAYG